MPFPVSGAFLQSASTGKVFGKNTGASGEDDFSQKPSGPTLPVETGGLRPLPRESGWLHHFLFLPFPFLGNESVRVNPGVKGDRSVEGHTLLSLESLDEPCGTGREKLFQMLVRQFLVQESAVHGQSAPFIVTAGTLLPDDDVSGLAFGTGECAGGCCRKAEVQDFTGSLAGVVRDGCHERVRSERVPLYLEQGFLPASCQGNIRHEHVLHRIVDMESTLR